MTNKKFEALTSAEKRVAIAKDVLASIKVGKYRAKTGSYVNIWDNTIDCELDIKSNFDAIEECNVCALGGIILSITKQRNKLNFGDLECITSDETIEKLKLILKGIFTPTQLESIEFCFEGAGIDPLTERLYKKSPDYDEIYSEYCRKEFYDVDRLIMIMNNIIRNKGTFIPIQDL